MPLKTVYAKAPLVDMKQLPLCPGQFRTDNEWIRRTERLAATELANPAIWAAAFRLSCIVNDHPAGSDVYGMIMNALSAQNEDGSLPFDMKKSLDAVCAAWAVYTWNPDREILEHLLNWCRWASGNWASVMECEELRRSSADLMAVMTGLYRVSGRKGILTLCDRLRRDAMDWSGALHTFSVARPMKKLMTAEELDRGMAEERLAETHAESGFYTHQYLTCHGEYLADGARSCLESAVFSGNRQETVAARTGWQRISRRHSAACGGVTADETLAGQNPSAGVDAAALGAWAEVFAAQLTREEGNWAEDELELLMENGLKACFNDAEVIPFQRVNSLKQNCGTRDCYRVHAQDEQKSRAVIRLARAWAAIAANAVTVSANGADIHLLLDGDYRMKLKDTQARLTVSKEENGASVTVRVKAPVTAAIRIRIPGWMDSPVLSVNGEAAGTDNGVLIREWKDGDIIRLNGSAKITLAECGHQAVSVRLGTQVLSAVPGENWAVAMVGEPELRNGQVFITVRNVPGWRSANGTPVDIPVLPATEGEECELVMVPYCTAPCRMTVLPRGKRA